MRATSKNPVESENELGTVRMEWRQRYIPGSVAPVLWVLLVQSFSDCERCSPSLCHKDSWAVGSPSCPPQLSPTVNKGQSTL